MLRFGAHAELAPTHGQAAGWLSVVIDGPGPREGDGLTDSRRQFSRVAEA